MIGSTSKRLTHINKLKACDGLPPKMESPKGSPLHYDYLGSVLKSNSVPIEVIPIEFIEPMSELARWSAWKSPIVRMGGPTAKLDVRCGCGGRDIMLLLLSGCPKPTLMPLPITPLMA